MLKQDLSSLQDRKVTHFNLIGRCNFRNTLTKEEILCASQSSLATRQPKHSGRKQLGEVTVIQNKQMEKGLGRLDMLLYHATTIRNISSVWEGVRRSLLKMHYPSGWERKDGGSPNSDTHTHNKIVLKYKKEIIKFNVNLKTASQEGCNNNETTAVNVSQTVMQGHAMAGYKELAVQ